jgi:hypothetical protein
MRDRSLLPLGTFAARGQFRGQQSANLTPSPDDYDDTRVFVPRFRFSRVSRGLMTMTPSLVGGACGRPHLFLATACESPRGAKGFNVGFELRWSRSSTKRPDIDAPVARHELECVPSRSPTSGQVPREHGLAERIQGALLPCAKRISVQVRGFNSRRSYRPRLRRSVRDTKESTRHVLRVGLRSVSTSSIEDRCRP